MASKMVTEWSWCTGQEPLTTLITLSGTYFCLVQGNVSKASLFFYDGLFLYSELKGTEM